jgi:hypothetical protein
MTSQTENNVTSRLVNHGFPLMFNTRFESIVYRSQVKCVSERSVRADCQFRVLEASQTRGNVAILQFDYSFLVLFNTYYFSGAHHLKVTLSFLIVTPSGMSILNTKKHLITEVRSLVDRATTVFYSRFVDNFHLSSTVSTL